jgi:hypothetical protein
VNRSDRAPWSLRVLDQGDRPDCVRAPRWATGGKRAALTKGSACASASANVSTAQVESRSKMVPNYDPYRINVTTGGSERYGAVLFSRKSLPPGTGASTPLPPGGVQSGVHPCSSALSTTGRSRCPVLLPRTLSRGPSRRSPVSEKFTSSARLGGPTSPAVRRHVKTATPAMRLRARCLERSQRRSRA